MSILQDHAGFNVTSSKLQLVEFNFEDDNLVLENVDEEDFSEILVSDLQDLNNVDIFRQSFSNLLSRKPLYSKRVSFTLPDEFFRIASFPIETELTEEDLNDHIKWELSVLFPTNNIDDYAVQSVKMPLTQFSFTPSVLVYAINKNLLKLIHQFCTDNQLELNYVDNAHVASNSLIPAAGDEEELHLSIYLYAKSFSLIILKGSTPVYRSSTSLPSIEMFDTLFAGEIEKLNELGLLVSNISKFYIAGEGLESIDTKQIHSSSGIELFEINPFVNLSISPSLSSGTFVNQLKGSFTAAAGISLRLV